MFFSLSGILKAVEGLMSYKIKEHFNGHPIKVLKDLRKYYYVHESLVEIPLMRSKDIQQMKEESLHTYFFYNTRICSTKLFLKYIEKKILHNRISKVLPYFRDGETTETSSIFYYGTTLS